MSTRISPRTRLEIIEFPDKRRRGEVTRFCVEHHISIASFYKIRALAARGGPDAAVVPSSTAPARQAGRTSALIEDEALRIRAELTRQGWDAGPISVAAEMTKRGLTPPSRATLARIFTRRGVVTPQPAKKPRAAWQRFVYPDPNGCWQLDGMDYKLDSGISRCVLQVEDDNSRKIMASLVAVSENANAAVTVVAEAIRRHGAPAKFLTDNGAAFNQSRRGSESRLERFLKQQGVTPITGRPSHPTTQGKNERLHQTLTKFLDAHRPINTVERLTRLVAEFEDYYNNQRPHQGIGGQTPTQAYEAKPKALPAPEPVAAPPGTAKHLTATPSPHALAHGPRRHYKGATPVPDAPGLQQMDRRVGPDGAISACGCHIYVGKHLARTLVHILFDDQAIQVIDTNGVIAGVTNRPIPAPPSQQTPK